MGYSAYQLREKRSFRRILELRMNPIQGDFTLSHLKRVHSYIFQDSPEIAGKFRPELSAEGDKLWRKKRTYAGFGEITVYYSPMDQASIQEAELLLKQLNIARLNTLSKAQFATVIATIYQQLDYIHPFLDGNSRTLREFTRALSQAAGFKLDWTKNKQSEVYLARDFAVNSITLARVTDPLHKRAIRDEIDAILCHKEYKPLEKVMNDALTKCTINLISQGS